MVTVSLILAAVLVVLLLAVVVGQCCESGSMWFFHLMLGTPAALCRLLGLIVLAIFENLGESN